MGSQPATRFGMPNWSAPVFPRPIGSSPIIGVVGTPVLILKMLPNSHPPRAAFPTPDFGPGTSQSPLTDKDWPTLKSDGPRSALWANQNVELREFAYVSPAMVEELSSIDFDQV